MNAVPQIRRATVADASEVARLCAQWGYPVSEQILRARLEALISVDSHAVLVAELDDSLLGWCSGEVRITLGSDRRVEITGLVVDTAARRHGIGSQLVAQLEDWARTVGCDEVFLRTNVARAESHPFYERMGFVRNKTQHAYKKGLRGGNA